MFAVPVGGRRIPSLDATTGAHLLVTRGTLHHSSKGCIYGTTADDFACLFHQRRSRAELSPYHRLLFIGLLTEGDRLGRVEARPRRVRARLFPFDEVMSRPCWSI